MFYEIDFGFYLTDRLNAELINVKKINMIPISVFKHEVEK